eukprot:PhF_6_TR32504/c0_g1_i1/m.48163
MKGKQLAVGIAGAVVVGGVIYYLTKSKKPLEAAEETEFSDDFSLKREKSYDVDTLLNREASSIMSAESKSEGKPTTDESEGVFVYENLGLVMKLPPSWRVADDMSPLPNICMLTLQNLNYNEAEQMPGQAPILIISVEDVSQEGLDIVEFKEKSKMMAMQQMAQMTGGRIPPQITQDGAIEIGPFKMCLQYNLMSPFMQMTVLNYMTMENNLAYCIQFMGSPQVFSQHESEVNEIAKNFQITKLKFKGPPSYTTVASKEHSFTAQVSPNWIIQSIGKDSQRLLELHTPSPTKTESIEILRCAGGEWNNTSLEKLCTEDRGTAMKMSNKDGVTVMKYKNNASHDILVVARGAFCVKVTPLKVAQSVLREADVLKVLNNIIPSAAEDQYVYRNVSNGFSFHVKTQSRLVECRLGDNSVTYAPEGVPMSPSDEATPMFTVRCGDPSTEKDCEATLEDWMKRLKLESSGGEGIKILDLRFDTIAGHRAVSLSQTEMQEVGPGMREEHKSKLIIFVEGGKTYMLRWETPTGVWRKYEPKLYRLLDTFTFA